MDDVIEQEALGRLGCIRLQRPGALALADRVPCPDRVLVQGGHMRHRHHDLAMGRGHPRPIALGKAVRLPDLRRNIERVPPVDLPQPGVLRPPGMVHRHRPLGQGVDGKALVRLGKRRIPDRQRVHRLGIARLQMLRRRQPVLALGGQLEPAQRFAPEREQVRRRLVVQPDLDGPILIGRVPRLVELRLVRDVGNPEAAVLLVFLDLVRVRRTTPVLVPISAPTRQRPDARPALMVLDVVGVIRVFLAAILVHEPWQA